MPRAPRKYPKGSTAGRAAAARKGHHRRRSQLGAVSGSTRRATYHGTRYKGTRGAKRSSFLGW